MPTRTISAAGGTRAWSDTATWDEGAVPTSADDVVARGDGTSGNVTVAADGSCQSINLANYVGTLTINTGIDLNVGSASGGALTFVAGMTFTMNGATSRLVFVSTSNNGGAGWNVTMAGKSATRMAFTGNGGRWSLQGAVVCTDSLSINAGTLDTNGVAITCLIFVLATNTTKTLNLSTSTITMTATTTATILTLAGTATTVNGSSATFVVSGSNPNTRTVALNSKTIGALTRTGATGAGSIAFTQSGTIGTLTLTNSGGSAYTVRLTAGITITTTTLVLTGTSGAVLTLDTTAAGTPATFGQAAGTVDGNWLSIKDSTATGGAAFWAENSTSVSGNTGWNFGARRTLTDAEGLTDSRSFVAGYARSQTDAEGLTDSSSTVQGHTRALTDTEALTDSRTVVAGYARSATDPLGMTDQLAVAAGYLRTLTDQLGLTDSVAAALQLAVTITDALGLADTVLTEAGYVRTVTDAEGATDAVAISQGFVRSVTDQLGLVDSVTTVQAHARTVTDAEGLTDQVSYVHTVVILVTLTDHLGLDDSLAVVIVVGPDNRFAGCVVVDPTTRDCAPTVATDRSCTPSTVGPTGNRRA